MIFAGLFPFSALAQLYPIPYGFAGPADGGVSVSSSPFSASQQMNGWSAGIGGDLQLSPNWSVGLKYRHFDLGSTFFSVVPGTHLKPHQRARRPHHRHAELSLPIADAARK